MNNLFLFMLIILNVQIASSTTSKNMYLDITVKIEQPSRQPSTSCYSKGLVNMSDVLNVEDFSSCNKLELENTKNLLKTIIKKCKADIRNDNGQRVVDYTAYYAAALANLNAVELALRR